MVKNSLHTKVITIILTCISLFIFTLVYFNYKYETTEHMESRLESMDQISSIILHTIYEDMSAGRADLARKVIESINTSEHHSLNETNDSRPTFVQIVRNNGTERAFHDLKTINKVTEKLENLSVTTELQWLEGHVNKQPNIAPKTDSKNFKKYFAKISSNWKSKPVHYIEDDNNELVYLAPIEERKECLSCHEPMGGRGIIMITEDLSGEMDEMFNLAVTYTVSGIITILLLGFFTSAIIKKSITGPLNETVTLIDNITKDENYTSERLEINSNDEIGLLSQKFNSMLNAIESREQTLKTLFKSIDASTKEWRTTFDSIQELIAVYNYEGKLMKCNMSFALRYNKKPEELVGKTCSDILDCGTPTSKCSKIAFDWGKAQIERGEYEIESLGGTFDTTRIPKFDNRGNVVATIFVLRDITEEKELKKQLIQSEKMKSIGQLVAGIAHELNNPLMGITGYSEILMDTPGDKTLKDIKPKIEKIYQEALRTAKIVQQLLVFARAKEIQKNPHNINDIILDTIELKEYATKKEGIEITTDLSPHVTKTMVDYYQLQQVFINIITNAIDAIKEKSTTGKIEISTAVKGRTLYISFKDNGPGMSEETLTKVFDPFFSTKEVGKGTGLGLSISHGIIKDHGGWIDIKSKLGEGTTITIEIPLEMGAEEEPYTDTHDEASETASTRGISVLVVDDEPNIREFVSDAMAAAGFSVDTARDGVVALEMIGEKKYSLVISDIKMPNLGGHELYTIINEKHKYLAGKIILLTGDVFSEDIKSFLDESRCPYLLKPFELKTLMALVKEVLG